VANIEREKQGKLSGQDKRVQRVMEHLWGDMDEDSVYKIIHKQFKLSGDDKLCWQVAQRITEKHCNCEGYTDADIAELLEHVLTRDPLPLDERVLSDLERYHYKDGKKLKFYFVLQEHHTGMGLLWFVDKYGCRVSVPDGVSAHTESGQETPEMGGCFVFCWFTRNELRFEGKRIVTLAPQCSRVVSDKVTVC
jgi:hypothetical protein